MKNDKVQEDYAQALAHYRPRSPTGSEGHLLQEQIGAQRARAKRFLKLSKGPMPGNAGYLYNETQMLYHTLVAVRAEIGRNYSEKKTNLLLARIFQGLEGAV